MVGVLADLTNHGLDDTNVSIQETPQTPGEQGEPEVCGEAHEQHGDHCSGGSDEQDRFPSYPVTEHAPEHAHRSLCDGEGGNEDTSIGSGIVWVTEFEGLDHGVSIWDD